MIPLRQINGNVIDLSKCAPFVEHYNKPNSFAKEILEECNSRLWYDECLERLPKNAFVVDAGANARIWSMWILPKVGRLMTIEPSEEHDGIGFEMLPDAMVLHAALTNYDGSGWFHTVSENTTCSALSDSGRAVRCLRLGTPLPNVKIDLLKLDIEGAEQQVIIEDETSGEALKRCGIVYVEVHPPPYGNADEQAIIDKMISLGFTHKKGARELSHYFVQP